MPKTERLTIDRLRQVLDFDPATGLFRWRIGRRGCSIGRPAGTVENKYRIIRIDGVDYQAARLAWLWVNEEWPRVIRFQNNDPSDLRIVNLRNGYYVRTKHNWKTKEGKSAAAKEYYQRTWHKVREKRIKDSFGLEPEEYRKMHDKQKGLCAICGQPETTTRNGKPRWLAVDHCHASNKVRGLLCGSCNPMIGYAKDSVDLLRKAIAYLTQHQTEITA